MTLPQLHLSAVQRRLETPERLRLVIFVLVLALVTILQIGFFHLKFEATVRTTPGTTPLGLSQRIDTPLEAKTSEPTRPQNVVPRIPERSLPSQQAPRPDDLEFQRRSRIALTAHANAVLSDRQIPNQPSKMESRPKTHMTKEEVPELHSRSPTKTINTTRSTALKTQASAVLAGWQVQNQTSNTSSRPHNHTTKEIPVFVPAKKQLHDDATLQLGQLHNNISNAALTYNDSFIPRFDVLAYNHSPDPQFPPDFSNVDSVVNILQNNSFDLNALRPLNFTLRTDMLGILVDAGRHYFHVWWLKRLIDVLAVLQFNFIHFRLTDDQAFAIQLESQPNLTWPARFQGQKKRVYSRRDIRYLIARAREKNITIIPEINVPGHAGAWMGIPGLVVPCRTHACNIGYALPLNISHPNIRNILTDVIREVLDIFENPPYLHLGGDEMELAQACFDEVGAQLFDYNEFEGMLQSILRDVGYPEEQVIRWRETNFAHPNAPHPMRTKTKRRAGKINHWWHDTPGKTENVTAGTPIIGSARLYMDVNFDEAAWEVFLHSRKWWHLEDVFPQSAPVNIQGIIVGTFELGAGFFHSRNVIGRLLAVTLGASNLPISSGNHLNAEYSRWCHYVGFPDALCRRYATPLADWETYRGIWQFNWVEWRQDLCARFPMPVLPEVTIENDTKALSTSNQTNEVYLANSTLN